MRARAIDVSDLLATFSASANLHNAIEAVYVTDPGGTNSATEYCPNSKITGYCSEMANIGKEVHEGVEFEVRSTPFSKLTVSASYSYLNRIATLLMISAHWPTGAR